MRMFNALALTAALVSPLYAPASLAQTSAADVLEKARAQSKEFNEYKAALNDPDPNVRLAVFETMLHSDSEPIRQIALETGLSSADNLIRAAALKYLVMGLTQLHINLASDPTATKPQQEAVKNYLAKKGSTLVLFTDNKNMEQATFRSSSWAGQITGLDIKLLQHNSRDSAELTLQDDGTLKGRINLEGGKTPFLATVRLM